MDSIGYGFVSGCRSLTTITFPKTGKAVAEMQKLTPSRFGGNYLGGDLPKLKEIRSIPNAAYEKILQGHLDLLAGMGDPKGYLLERSEAVTSKAREITAGRSSDYEKLQAIHQWVAQISCTCTHTRWPQVRRMSAHSPRTCWKPGGPYAPATPISPAPSVRRWESPQPTSTAGWAMRRTTFRRGRAATPGTWPTRTGRWIILDSTWGRPGGNGGLGDRSTTTGI